MNEENKKAVSITVEFWSKIFLIFSFLSTFKLVCLVLRKTVKPKNMYSIVDIWVLFNLFFALSSIFIARYSNSEIIKYVLVTYGLMRVFEIIVCQINILLFDQYRADKACSLNNEKPTYKIRGFRRLVINLFCNFAEIIFWFSVSYCCFISTHFVKDYEPSLLQILLTSFSYTTGFGIHDLLSLPRMSTLGTSILYFQSVAGLVMTFISISRFIAMLPPIESMDEYENKK